MSNKSIVFVLAGSLIAFAIVGCSKKIAKAPVPPAPPAPAPTATLTASRSSIEAGQSVVLNWDTQNANQITIALIGSVAASGSTEVQPGESTTYQLVAKGPGGTAEASARVTVTTPAPVTTVAALPSQSEADLFAQSVNDIYFDFDKYDLRTNQEQSAQSDSQFLASHPDIQFAIEGHCDDRGSDEYNLALGDSRAEAVKTYLVRAGVNPDRIRVISYGKEHPFCTEDDDQCWQQNRRAHFVFLEQKAQLP